jgi:hypothetical protein
MERVNKRGLWKIEKFPKGRKRRENGMLIATRLNPLLLQKLTVVDRLTATEKKWYLH